MIRKILSAFGWREFLKILMLFVGGSILLGYIAESIGLNVLGFVYSGGLLLFIMLIIRKVIQNRRGKKGSEEEKDA